MIQSEVICIDEPKCYIDNWCFIVFFVHADCCMSSLNAFGLFINFFFSLSVSLPDCARYSTDKH